MIIGVGGKIGAGKTTLIKKFLKINREFNYLNLDEFVKNNIYKTYEFEMYLKNEFNYQFDNIDNFINIITKSFDIFEKYTLFCWNLIQNKIFKKININDNWIIEGAVINRLKFPFDKTIYIDCKYFLDQAINRSKNIGQKLIQYIIRIQQKYIDISWYDFILNNKDIDRAFFEFKKIINFN